MDVETAEFIPQTKLQANRHVQTPTDIFQGERALSVFDCSGVWGTKSSVNRFERLARLRKILSTRWMEMGGRHPLPISRIGMFEGTQANPR
jgi:hypothetical protein